MPRDVTTVPTNPVPALPGAIQHAWSALSASGKRAWHTLHLGAQIAVLAFSPSTYRSPWRQPLARQVYLDTWPLLTWFAMLSGLVSLVLIRIVIVTSQSYGLSHYAVQAVVRVLVLELLPLGAALFVALRCTIPQHAVGPGMPVQATPAPAGHLTRLRGQVAPRVLAGMFAVLTLAALSGLIALLLTYVLLYGFNPWAWAPYTRTVGQIFSPEVSLVLALKAFGFSLAVALVPAQPASATGLTARTELQLLVQVFSWLIGFELLSLLGNYS